jgi:amino acid transporter
LAQCPAKIPPRCAAPFTKGGVWVPSFDKGGTGRIFSQQVSQCTNVMWTDLTSRQSSPCAPVRDHEPPTQATLVATSCGTAIAAVCAIGLFQIERLVSGVWSVAAVATAGACCLLLARALGRLTEIVPSGAGLLAYLSRSFGRSIGFALTIPYFLLTLFLSGAEASIVGVLGARVFAIPVWLGAGAFLIGTWILCMAGVRLSYRVQALTTWTLVGTLSLLSLSVIRDTAAHGRLVTLLFPPHPTVEHFIAAVGQALFLFMGFELITSQVEITTTPRIVARSLSTSVLVLTG